MKLTDQTFSRTVNASPEEVFAVWIDPTSPGGPWFGTERVILNLVVDGLFYHAVRHEGRTWAHYGRFIQIERPRFSRWTWWLTPRASASSTWRFPTTDAAWAPPGLRLRSVSSWPSVVGSA